MEELNYGRRYQNPSNFPVQQPSFTFRNNLTPRLPYRSMPPSFSMRGQSNVGDRLQTPNLNNQWNYQKNNFASTDDDYAAAFQSMDYDGWGMDQEMAEETVYNEDAYINSHENSFLSNRKDRYNNILVNNMVNSTEGYTMTGGNKRKPIFQQQPDENLYSKNNLKSKSTETNKKSSILSLHQKMKEATSYAQKFTPLRQAVLTTSAPNGLGYKLEKPSKGNSVELAMETTHKAFPKWSYSDTPPDLKFAMENKEGHFPRIFTVTVEKLLSWPKILCGGKAIFELYGILERVTDGKFPKSKNIVLKNEKMRTLLNCTFYEIDRPLPKLNKCQWQRCIILLRSYGEYQCLNIRSATATELKNMDAMVINSSKSKAVLLKFSGP